MSAAEILRDYHKNQLSSNILQNERKISFGSQKFSFDEETPFTGINLISLYIYAKHRNNKKKVFSEFQRLSLPIVQPGGALAKQINEFLNSSAKPNTSTTSNHTSASQKSGSNRNDPPTRTSANHHFSFDDEPKKADSSLAAFDIGLSGSVSTQNNYSYSFEQTAETRSYAPPAETTSYSHSYSIPDSEDLISSGSRSYSLPVSPVTSSDLYGIPASFAMDVSSPSPSPSARLSPRRREREPRSDQDNWRNDRRDDRREGDRRNDRREGDRREREPRSDQDNWRNDRREGDRRNDREENRRNDRAGDRDNRNRDRTEQRRERPEAPLAAATNYRSQRTDIRSSLVVAPPKEFWGPIVTIKKNHMNPKIKRPPYPHITLLAPFLNFSLLPEARAVLKEKLSTIQPFKIELNQFQIYYNKTSFTLYLAPTVSPAGSLERLYQACLDVYPQCTKGPFDAHIGVGYFHSRREAEMHLQKYQYDWQPFSFTVQEIYIMGRVSETDPFEVRQVVPLGGAEPVPFIKPVPF